jgi:hypothetical protein
VLALQDSKFLVEAVEDVGKISKAGHLKVSWPAVRKWLLSKKISKEAKSCRLRCDFKNMKMSKARLKQHLHTFH